MLCGVHTREINALKVCASAVAFFQIIRRRKQDESAMCSEQCTHVYSSMATVMKAWNLILEAVVLCGSPRSRAMMMGRPEINDSRRHNKVKKANL